MHLHWFLKTLLIGVFLGAVLTVGGVALLRFSVSGSNGAALGGLLFIGGVPIGLLTIVVGAFRGWRKQRRARSRAARSVPGRGGVGMATAGGRAGGRGAARPRR
jgi:hypothetical protein